MTRPSWQDYGTYDESEHARLWNGVVGAWCPGLGPTGSRLYDHSRFNRWGTLTNMDNASDWQISRGVYSLRTTGTNTAGNNGIQDRIEIAYDYGQLNIITFSAWIWPVTLNKRGICTSGPTFTIPRFAIQMLTTGQIEGYRGGNTNSTGSVTTGQWNFISVSNDGSVTRYHINGKFDSQANQGITQNTQTTFNLSNNYWGAFEGFMADAVIHNRILSTGEHADLYRLGPCGMYERRRRSRRRVVEAAAGFKAYWARRQGQIIGGGV